MPDNNSETKKRWIKWAEKRIYSMLHRKDTWPYSQPHWGQCGIRKQQSRNMRSRGSLKRWNNRGRVKGSTNVVVSLRDVNKPVNTLTTTSERFEAGWHMRPCIRPDRLLHLLPCAPPPPFILLPNLSDEMIIIVRNRRAAHFRACRSRRVIFHPLK